MPRCARLAALTLGSIACVASGCSTPSTGLATSDLTADFHVDVNDDPQLLQTEVYGFVKKGLNDVILGDGDTLNFSTEKDAKQVLPKNNLNFYKVVMKGVTDRSQFTFSLTRTSATSAPSSTITVPAALALTAPTKGDAVSYAGGKLDIAWSNPVSGGTIHVFAYPCGGAAASTQDVSAPDSGTLRMKTSDLIVGSPPTSPQCVTVRILRSSTGTVDPAFAAKSTFVADRYDYVDVSLGP